MATNDPNSARMFCCQRGQLNLMRRQERSTADEHRSSSTLDNRCKRCVDVAIASDLENNELLPNRLRRRLHVALLRHDKSSNRRILEDNRRQIAEAEQRQRELKTTGRRG